jgi:hypothetical protein
MFSDGIKAFVSSSPYGDGWMHIAGRMSAYIRFPIPRLLEAFNRAEGLDGKSNRWGGGETIGGAPRIGGSKLPPEEVAKIVEETLKVGK